MIKVKIVEIDDGMVFFLRDDSGMDVNSIELEYFKDLLNDNTYSID